MTRRGHRQTATPAHIGAGRTAFAFTSFVPSACPCASPGLDLWLNGVNGIENGSAKQRFVDYSRSMS